jgi:hypothetical protein
MAELISSDESRRRPVMPLLVEKSLLTLDRLLAGDSSAPPVPKPVERRVAPRTRVNPFSLGERSMKLAIAVVYGLGVVAAGWSWKAGLSIPAAELTPVALATLIAIAVIFASCSAKQRLGGSKPRAAKPAPGGVVVRQTERLQLLAMAGLLLLHLAFIGTVMAHLAFGHSDGSDLRDTAFLAFDTRLRFDWTAFITRLNRHPALGHMLITANIIAPVLIAATVISLGVANRRRDLAEFLCSLSLATAAAITLLVLVPTAGAYSHLQPDAGLFAYLNPAAGKALAAMIDAWHGVAAPGVEAVTAGPGRVVTPLDVGVVMMVPSLQAATAVLVVYAVRRLSWIGVPVAALCVLTMVATLSDQGQYLSQVLVGAMLATGCILATKALRFKRVKKVVVVRPKVDHEAGILTWKQP